MEPLIVVAEEKANFLAEISYLLGQARVVIEELNSAVVNGRVVVTLIVRQADTARRVLGQNGYELLDARRFVLKTNNDGEREQIDRLLKQNHVKIEQATVLARDEHNVIYSYAVDKQKTARRVLKPFLLQGLVMGG